MNNASKTYDSSRIVNGAMLLKRNSWIVTLSCIGSMIAPVNCGLCQNAANGAPLNITTSDASISIPGWARGKVINEVRVPRSDRVIALTFDDGPNPPYTRQILKILKDHQAKATFFLVGEELSANRSLAKQILSEGHAVGNHSWSHPSKPSNPASEVKKTDNLIKSVLGIEPVLFRPPYGITTNGMSKAAQSNGAAVFLWSIDTVDWHRPGTKRIVSRVVHNAAPGRIALMHDGGGNRSQTVAALPQILDTLKKQGYRFVTIPELLALRVAAPVESQSSHSSKKPTKSRRRSKPGN